MKKIYTEEDILTIIRCCWNAAREYKVPNYVKSFDDLTEYIKPTHLVNPRADKIDFKHYFKVSVSTMHKYVWSYNWSNSFLKQYKCLTSSSLRVKTINVICEECEEIHSLNVESIQQSVDCKKCGEVLT